MKRKAENLTLVESGKFGEAACDFYQGNDGEIRLTRRQIGEALDYRDPDKAIGNIHERHKGRLDQFSVVLKLRGTDGKLYDTYLYSWKGLYEICRWSNRPNANAFIDWAWEILEKIRKGQMDLQAQRAIGMAIRRDMTDAIRDSGLNDRMHGFAYKTFSDLAYRHVAGMDARQFRKAHGLVKDANIREYLDTYQLERLTKAEKLIQGCVDAGADYEMAKVVLSQIMPRLTLVAQKGGDR